MHACFIVDVYPTIKQVKFNETFFWLDINGLFLFSVYCDHIYIYETMFIGTNHASQLGEASFFQISNFSLRV
jgi:hypothetical protein